MTKTRNPYVEDKRSRRRDSKDDKIKFNEENIFNKEAKQGSRLYVENVDASKRELEKLFSKFGPILETWSAGNRSRYAFVVFKHKDDAAEALDAMNGFKFQGNEIKVSYALPRSFPMEKLDRHAHRDTIRDSHRDTIRDSHRDTIRESHRDTIRDIHRDTIRESHRDNRHNNYDSSKNNNFKDRHKDDMSGRDQGKDKNIHTENHATRYTNTHPNKYATTQINSFRNNQTNRYGHIQTHMQQCYQCGRVGHLMRQCWNNGRDAGFFRGRGRRTTHPYPRSPQPARVSNMLDDLTDVYADART